MSELLDLGAVVAYQGKLWEVVGIRDGRSYLFHRLTRARDDDSATCPTCGHVETLDLGVDGLAYRELQPVPTIERRG